jgi:predicted RNA-binding protein with PIN domain
MKLTKSTHHSTEMDIVDRLEWCAISTPEVHMLREAAQYIRKLREELAEAMDDRIFVVDSDGNEMAVIEGTDAARVREAALTEFITKSVLEKARERQEQ